jgi:hypothetical protein
MYMPSQPSNDSTEYQDILSKLYLLLTNFLFGSIRNLTNIKCLRTCGMVSLVDEASFAVSSYSFMNRIFPYRKYSSCIKEHQPVSDGGDARNNKANLHNFCPIKSKSKLKIIDVK